jgi:hypothetical protein
MENEVFKILTKVRKYEISRIDAMEKLLLLFDVSVEANWFAQIAEVLILTNKVETRYIA